MQNDVHCGIRRIESESGMDLPLLPTIDSPICNEKTMPKLVFCCRVEKEQVREFVGLWKNSLVLVHRRPSKGRPEAFDLR